MEVTFIREDTGFDALAGSWNNLLAQAVTDVPFLRYEYQRAWWSTRGGGEWDEADLWIGVGRDQRGEVRGIAPLFFTRTRENKQGFMLLGCIEISDYLDFIVSSEESLAFVEALLTTAETEGPEDWQIFDLYNIPEGSPNLQALESAAERHGWEVARERLQPCPVVVLDGTWEDYLSRLDRKQRHELKRKLRRAARHPSGVEWQLIRSEDDIEKAIEDFLQLMTNDQRKIDFMTSEMRTQFQSSIKAAHENDWLHLSFLKVAHEPVAGYLCFDYGGRLWVYNSGLSAAHLSLSPGWVLLAHLIRWSLEHGLKEFDFLRGDEEYKYQLGGVNRYINRMVITRK